MTQRRRLPPMNAIKAFDASARCGGFTAAAQELCVSPGAVSRHVANLENFFGEPLFERHHNEVQLTAVGAQYFSRIRPALDVIEDASRRIVESSNPRQAHIATGPGIGRDWLLPLLPEFMDAHPDIEIELSTSLAQIDEIKLDLEDIDIVIHYNLTDITSSHCELLFETELQVVCSPDKAALCRQESDLYDQTLLYGLHSLTVWRQWFDLAGIEPPGSAHSLKFGDGSLATEAAVNGLGFALGETVCIANDLKSGRLVSPFPHRLHTGNKFFMTVNPEREQWHGVKALRKWIRQKAAESAPSPAAGD